ncbi:uncharacterized protein LOC130630543 [Hydractinia symbiolongicarpus]|uniref:uncharacterized protein LOC130630543 n=1 Tax=Hydractinia symbiolongicarpus TaxID=13093 RepID=UPI00254B34B8|nr:uncharacterized protein LOC130630543 [Hydractinia symbiolongicarpus]
MDMIDDGHYCDQCDLGFSSDAAYENHKSNFCPDKITFHQSQNISSGRKLASKGLSKVSSHGFSNKLQGYSLTSKYETNIEGLQRQANTLEKEKEAILRQLQHFEVKELEENQQFYSLPATKNYWKNTPIDEQNLSLEEKLIRMHESLNLKIPLRVMQQEYENNGGQDREVLQYFDQLEEEILNSQLQVKKVKPDHVLLELQNQLKMYKAQHEEMKKEIESLKTQQYSSKLSYGNQEHTESDNFYRGSRNNTRRGNTLINQSTFLKSYHEQRLIDMRQEAEIYRQQLELERLRHELMSLRGHPDRPVLPHIGAQITHSLPNQFINLESDFYQMSLHKQGDAFLLSPYDPGSGFSVFWDFVSMPNLISNCCRLLVKLYENKNAVSDTKTLPTVAYGQTNMYGHSLHRIPSSDVAVIGVKQMFPNCFPMTSLSLCVCLQTGNGQHNNMLKDVGWCKIDLFDGCSRLTCGRWKTPVRVLPIQPELNTASLNAVPQLGQTELYFRLVNSRDAASQEGILLSPQMMCSYKYPPVESQPIFALPQLALQQPKETLKPVTPESRANDPVFIQKQRDEKLQNKASNIQNPLSPQVRKQSEASIYSTRSHHTRSKTVIRPQQQQQRPSLSHLTVQENLGVQVDRIVDLSTSAVRLKVTVYNPNGEVALAENNKHAEFVTKFTRPSFLKDVHCYSLQQCWFPSLQLYQRSLLVVEAYQRADNNSEDDVLMAWSAVCLFQLRGKSESQQRTSLHSGLHSAFDLSRETILSGAVHMLLYEPPMLKVKKIIEKLQENNLSSYISTYSTASVLLHLFNDDVLPTRSPMAIPIVQLRHQIPMGAWLDHTREAPNKLFENGNGFDVYVDCGRFFPDSTVASRVVVSLHDGASNKSKAMKFFFETKLDLHTNALEPEYNARFEFRQFTFAPQSELVFAVYILDVVTKQVSLFGQSILPVFVKPNSIDHVDSSAESFCLNEGSIQLKLYQSSQHGTNSDKTFLKSSIPCSSLLVRLLPAACYPDGEAKKAADFPEDEWVAEGVLVPPRSYHEGRYDSQQCRPTPSVVELFHFFNNRATVMVKDAAKQIAPDGRKTKNEEGLLEWLKGKFKLQEQTVLFNTKYLLKYDSLHGLCVRLERAQNILWNGFTFATLCMSPPSAYYQGSVDDPLIVLTQIDPDSLQRHPQWFETTKVLPRRQFHPNLAVIVHLYEVVPQENIFTISSQAWTVLPVCTMGYLSYGVYQLPVFQGAPSKQLISDIQSQPLIPAIATMRKKKLIKVIDGTSVYLRIGDPRRIDELENEEMKVNQTYLPRSNKFLSSMQSKSVRTLTPAGIPVDDYIINVGKAFQNLLQAVFEKHQTTNT